jgi:hypothetical protein
MSKKIQTAVKTAVEVLSTKDKAFIDTDIVSLLENANKAELKKSELIFKASANVEMLIGKDCTKQRWELIFADIENRLVNTKGILPSTARNYGIEIKGILKEKGIKKPNGTSKTAKHTQAKKAQADEIAKKYEHESLENLATELTQLIGLTDKNSVEKFKEVSKVVVEKTKAKEKQDKENETQELKDFKDQYTTWFNGLLKTQEGRTELIALRLNSEVRAVVQKVLS